MNNALDVREVRLRRMCRVEEGARAVYGESNSKQQTAEGTRARRDVDHVKSRQITSTKGSTSTSASMPCHVELLLLLLLLCDASIPVLLQRQSHNDATRTEMALSHMKVVANR